LKVLVESFSPHEPKWKLIVLGTAQAAVGVMVHPFLPSLRGLAVVVAARPAKVTMPIAVVRAFG
jgi:hypothetical protein